MANTRRRRETTPAVAGAPSGTGSWVDTPATSVGSPAAPRIDSNGGGEEWNIGSPYSPSNNSGVNGGNTTTPAYSNPGWNIAPPSQNVGPWMGGIGPQPGNVTIPGQTSGTGTTGSAGSAFSGIAGDWRNPSLDMIKAYGRSRGVELTDQQAGYWTTQWGNLMRETPNDPSYAQMRLSLANEWTPANERYMAGSEFTDPWGGTLEQLVQSFLGNSRERATNLANTYRSRAKELRDTPAYSAQDEAAIQARAYDQLERRRQETLKNERERIYARGFAPTSGTVSGRERDVNTQFEQTRTGISSDILRAQLDETNRRKDAALQLEALATEALNGGDLSAIQATGLPLQLMNTRQNNALATYSASNGGNIASLLSMLLNSASGQQNTTNNQNANNAAGYGNLLSVILNSLFPRS